MFDKKVVNVKKLDRTCGFSVVELEFDDGTSVRTVVIFETELNDGEFTRN